MACRVVVLHLEFRVLGTGPWTGCRGSGPGCWGLGVQRGNGWGSECGARLGKLKINGVQGVFYV